MGYKVDNNLSIISKLPSGKFWSSKFNVNSNIYKLFSSIGISFSILENKIIGLLNEFQPLTTDELLVEWEKEFGLPDAFFTETENVEIRKRQISLKLLANNLITEADFKNFLEQAGFPEVDINMDTRTSVFDWTFDVTFGTLGNLFKVILTVPAPSSNYTALRNYIATLVPINVIVALEEK